MDARLIATDARRHVPGGATVKALTLHQPWASLIALGVKTIETRSWSTRYRGPLAIHAGRTLVPGHRGDWRCIGPTSDPYLVPKVDGPPHPLPLGAIVATCTLVDVVPMMEGSGLALYGQSALVLDLPHEGDLPHQQGGHWLIGVNDLTHGKPTRVEDQRPYGDFAPGRYAWLLADIVPCDPIPAKGKQGLWEWTP